MYDNVESADILMPYWPTSTHGHAVITTRNLSLAFEPASSGLEVTSWNAQTGSDFLLFLLKKNIGQDAETEATSALALCERLSGHALAIQHMAGLIHESAFSIQEFMNMYLKSDQRAHTTKELAVPWSFSFQSLDSDSLSLLGIMSFLMPDSIPQDLFESNTDLELSECFTFLSDAFK